MNSNFNTLNKDWENVKKRWEAWWKCEIYDRIPLMVYAPKDNVDVNQLKDIGYESQWEHNPEKEWIDADQMIKRVLNMVTRTYFGGEALPTFDHKWSVGYALLYGCNPHFNKNAAWCDPLSVKDEPYPELVFDRSGHWWNWMLETTKKAAMESKGRYYVRPDWGNSAGDILSTIRGEMQIMLDLADNQAWVKRAAKHLTNDLIKIYEEIWKITDLTGLEGSINYLTCWSPKKTLAFDCDISCMISNDMFKDIFLEPLVDTMNTVEHAIYHLDGPGAIKHLETLLDLKELNAIQWVPGAGKEDIMQWIPLIKQIQKRGKGVYINTKPHEIEPLMKEVSPEGLCISTYCQSESEAQELVNKVKSFY